MKFTQDSPGNELLFSDYDDSSVTINDRKHTDSLIVFPDNLLPQWAVSSIDQLSIDHLGAVIERRPDIVILGTGSQQQFPPVEVRRALAQNRLQLEIMNNAAACRTYNLLVSEDRDVAAAIIINKS
jgi:uncharacterized protein